MSSTACIQLTPEVVAIAVALTAPRLARDAVEAKKLYLESEQ